VPVSMDWRQEAKWKLRHVGGGRLMWIIFMRSEDRLV
jgi:hypothetical protein